MELEYKSLRKYHICDYHKTLYISKSTGVIGELMTILSLFLCRLMLFCQLSFYSVIHYCYYYYYLLLL